MANVKYVLEVDQKGGVKKLREFEDALGGTDKASKKAQSGVDKFASTLRGNGEASLQRMTSRLGPFGSALGAVGPAGLAAGVAIVGMTAAVAAAGLAIAKLVGVVSDVVSSYAAFEAELTKVETLVGISGDTVKKWGSEIIDMAPALGTAPRALAEGLFVVTSAGIRGAETMDVLTQAAKASAAGMGETKDIARLAVGAIQAYGKENLSASDAIDILAMTVREGNLEASSLATTMGKILPVASQLGISFQEAGAFVALFTRTGASAEEATTALLNTMTGILKPAKDAQDAMIGIGYSFDKLKLAIREKGLQQALVDLTERVKAHGKEVSAVFPNIRGLVGVLATAGSQAEVYAELMATSFKNVAGATDEAFERTTHTIDFAGKAIAAAGEATKVALGEAIANTPAFQEAMRGIVLGVMDMSKWVRDNREVIADWVMKGAYAFIAISIDIVSSLRKMSGAGFDFIKVVAAMSWSILEQGRVWVTYGQKLAQIAQEHPILARAMGIPPEVAQTSKAVLDKIINDLEGYQIGWQQIRKDAIAGAKAIDGPLETVEQRLAGVASKMAFAMTEGKKLETAAKDAGGALGGGPGGGPGGGGGDSLAGGANAATAALGGTEKALTKAEKAAKKAAAEYNTAFERMAREANALNAELEDMNQRALGRSREYAEAWLRAYKEREDAAKKALEAERAFKSQWQGISSAFSDAGSALGDLSSAMTQFGITADSVLGRTISNFQECANSASSFAANVASGNWLGAIASGIDLVGDLDRAFQGLVFGDGFGVSTGTSAWTRTGPIGGGYGAGPGTFISTPSGGGSGGFLTGGGGQSGTETGGFSYTGSGYSYAGGSMGLLTRPHLAMVGDGPQPEAVMTTTQIGNLVKAASSSSFRAQGGGMDPEVVALLRELVVATRAGKTIQVGQTVFGELVGEAIGQDHGGAGTAADRRAEGKV